jgi:hypothetical protein
MWRTPGDDSIPTVLGRKNFDHDERRCRLNVILRTFFDRDETDIRQPDSAGENFRTHLAHGAELPLSLMGDEPKAEPHL